MAERVGSSAPPCRRSNNALTIAVEGGGGLADLGGGEGGGGAGEEGGDGELHGWSWVEGLAKYTRSGFCENPGERQMKPIR